MARACPLCVYLVLLALLRAADGSPRADVDVWVFLPRNDSYLFSHARVAPAIRYAQRRLRSEPEFGGFNFNLHFHDSERENDALFQLVERACGDKPDLILGPVGEYEAAAVVRLASHWNIPVVSAGALAAGFSDKRREYSQLTRIAPSYVKMAETFTSMFEHFSWRSALLVFEDDKEQRNCYFTLEGIYHLMVDVTINTYTFLPEARVDTDDVIHNILGNEVVIMCMGAEKVREIMLAAHRRRLTSGNHMFFNVELFNASSYGNGSWRRGDKQDDEARQAYAALKTVTLLRTVKPEFENFSMEMKKSSKTVGFSDGEDSVNMFVEGFHDALLLYAIALHEAMKGGLGKKNGTDITARMWNRTFEGIAGQVSMDVNGDRNGDFSLMAMTNTEAGTYEVVANYFGINETLQLLPAFDVQQFTLRDRGADQPPAEGPDKSCGLGVSALTGVIVGVVLGSALIIAFYFFRKHFRITIERRTHADACESGKHRQLREDSIRSSFSAA
ncbi:atrial natriuretic peptide receptor 3 [Synchiropus picturatus]